MTIGIIYDENKEECFRFAKVLERTAENINKTSRDEISTVTAPVSDCGTAVASSDLLVSVGGDGTFLKTASAALSRNLPVCGFNLGTLGLLTEFEHDNPEKIIRRLADGNYMIEDRHVLRVQVLDGGGSVVFDEYALNDCVLERGTLAKLAYVTVNIGGAFVDNYPCNGIVVATQTGSTAYSMSAGGPIVEPGNDVIVVTPVCAHFTDGRPIIARADSVVSLKMRLDHDSMFVSVDGHKNIRFEEDFECRCLPSGLSVRVIRIDPPNFYEVLRQKAEERRRKLAR